MQGNCRSYAAFFTILLTSALTPGALASDFAFKRDTLAFVNATVFDYSEGRARIREKTTGEEKKKAYTRRCFVMSRAALRQNLEKLLEQPIEQLLGKRYKRFRALGNFSEGKAAAAASRF